MASELETMARAYRSLWRQEAAAIKDGHLKIIRNGQDESQAALERYELWASDISAMLDRPPHA